jgi:hypothetical protein
MSHELGAAVLPSPTAGQLRELETQIGIRLVGRIRNFRLSLRDGGMALEGRVQTYYAKQLAQHAVMESSDLPISVNEIEVV